MRDYLKTTLGMTEEDMARLPPNIMKMLAAASRLMSKKVVAKCVKSKYCAAGIKEGDKAVFVRNVINQQETTAPLCMRGIACLVTPVTQIMDLMINGLDTEIAISRIPCLDPGLDAGGLGRVVWEVSVE